MTDIRRAVRADLDVLVDLHRQFCKIDHHPFDDGRARAGFAGLLDDDAHGVVWIVDDPSAYAVLTWGWSIEAGGAEAVLDEIFVTERSAGIGSRLIEHVIADAATARVGAHLPRDRGSERARPWPVRAPRFRGRRLDLDEPSVRRAVVTRRRSIRLAVMVTGVLAAGASTAGCGSESALDDDLMLDATTIVDGGRVAAATMRVRANGCGPRTELGTATAIGDGVVVTAAHVVAGADDVVLLDAAGVATPADVVLFDPDLDVAALRAAGTTSSSEVTALLRAERATPGEIGLLALVGDDGSIELTDVEVLQRVTIETTDITGDRDVVRPGLRIARRDRARRLRGDGASAGRWRGNRVEPQHRHRRPGVDRRPSGRFARSDRAERTLTTSVDTGDWLTPASRQGQRQGAPSTRSR